MARAASRGPRLLRSTDPLVRLGGLIELSLGASMRIEGIQMGDIIEVDRLGVRPEKDASGWWLVAEDAV